MFLKFLTLIVTALATNPAKAKPEACRMEQKHLLSITEFIPKAFSFNKRNLVTLVYSTMEGNEVVSMSTVYYVMSKDCSGKQAKHGFNTGNTFLLHPIQSDRSLLI